MPGDVNVWLTSPFDQLCDLSDSEPVCAHLWNGHYNSVVQRSTLNGKSPGVGGPGHTAVLWFQAAAAEEPRWHCSCLLTSSRSSQNKTVQFCSRIPEEWSYIQKVSPYLSFFFFFLHFKVSPSYSPRKEIQLTRSLSFFFFYSSKFVYFISWLWWVFIALHGFYLVVESKGCSSLCRSGFSPRWLLLLQSTGSRLVGSGVWLWALECAGFSSCSTWAWSCSSRALENGLSSCGTRA